MTQEHCIRKSLS